MSGKLTLRILLPSRQAVSREVDSVNLPASEGEVGILPGHAPLLAIVSPGPATIRDGGREEKWALGPGFLEVRDDVVTVFARSAESAEDIDVERARKRRDEREKQLRSEHLSEVEMKRAEMSLLKQLARLSVAGAR